MKKHPILRWILIIYLAVGVFSFIKYTVTNNIQNGSASSSRIAASPVPQKTRKEVLDFYANILLEKYPDHSRAEYDPDKKLFLLYFWDESLENVAANAICGIDPDVTKWDDVCSLVSLMSDTIQNGCDTAGYSDISVGVFLLYSSNKNTALLAATRGTILFDVVAESSVDLSSIGYTVDFSSSVFHLSICPELQNIPTEAQISFTGTRDYLLSNGYIPCSVCNP